MYAVVEIKGKQYKAVKGQTLEVDLLGEEAATTWVCDKVMLLSDGEKSLVGKPYISGASVKLSSSGETIKGKKIRVFKYKRRKKYRLTQGHRQQYSVVKVEDIQGSI
ncbi:MAG: 50S ribosomal protein L21 [Spirochaetota bacterium]